MYVNPLEKEHEIKKQNRFQILSIILFVFLFPFINFAQQIRKVFIFVFVFYR